MGFKFRMDVSLRLAKRELNRAQELLIQELYKLRQEEEIYQMQQRISLNAFQGQKEACRYEPQAIGVWYVFCNNQKQKLQDILLAIQKQKEIVLRQREELRCCKIKTEKFKRLCAKQWQGYCAEQLRQEQIIIDEIAQHSNVQYF